MNRIAELKKKKIISYNFDPEKIIEEIYAIDEKLQENFDDIYQNIIKQLRRKKICLVNEKQLTKEQGEFVKKFSMMKCGRIYFQLCWIKKDTIRF